MRRKHRAAPQQVDWNKLINGVRGTFKTKHGIITGIIDVDSLAQDLEDAAHNLRYGLHQKDLHHLKSALEDTQIAADLLDNLIYGRL